MCGWMAGPTCPGETSHPTLHTHTTVIDTPTDQKSYLEDLGEACGLCTYWRSGDGAGQTEDEDEELHVCRFVLETPKETTYRTVHLRINPKQFSINIVFQDETSHLRCCSSLRMKRL